MKFTAHKAWMAAVGTTLNAFTVFWASASLVLSDDAVDLNEYGSLATAVATLVGTVYAVWRVENKRIPESTL